MLVLTVLWILFLLVTIYDNQTELLLQTNLQLQIKKKKVSGQHTEKGYISEIDSWFLEGEVGQKEGEERGLCLLNSAILSREQPSLTSVAENFDSSFHLVSIRQGNLANGWPRNCSTCTSWPRAPVRGAKENEEISPGPSVQSRAGTVAFERKRMLFHPAGQVHKELDTSLNQKMPKPNDGVYQLF